MEFHSASFLFAFLPLTLLVHALVPWRRGRNAVLILTSLLFYALGDLRDIWLLLGSAVLHYLAGLLLMRMGRGKKAVLAAVVLLDLAVLLSCKLSGRLPLGVSFFTFQAISYAVDLSRDPRNGSRSFFEVLQYLTFFPQLVSGPLMKFSQVRPYLQARTASPQETAEGMCRFTRGLAKKLLLSVTAAEAANAVFALPPEALDIRTAWLGAVCYAVQLFFDFSGYSDMAIGLGHMFGYTLPENFRYPYCAASITDFWRRWHISLSAWFRDYLYIPLGGSRKGRVRTICNKLAVFLATGLWHGTSWTFLLWGLWHGLWSAVETAAGLPKRLEKRWYGHVYTLLVVILGFVLFRAGSLAQAAAIAGNMFAGFSLTAASSTVLAHVAGRRFVCFLLLGCVFCLPVGPALHDRLARYRAYRPACLLLTLLLLLLCMLTLASGAFQPSIYAQF